MPKFFCDNIEFSTEKTKTDFSAEVYFFREPLSIFLLFKPIPRWSHRCSLV